MRIKRCCYHKVDNFYQYLKNCLQEVGVVGDGGGSTPKFWFLLRVTFFLDEVIFHVYPSFF